MLQMEAQSVSHEAEIEEEHRIVKHVDYFPSVTERRKAISQCIAHMIPHMHIRDWLNFDKYCKVVEKRYKNDADFDALIAIYNADKLRLTGQSTEAVEKHGEIESLILKSSSSQILLVSYLINKALVMQSLGQFRDGVQYLNQAMQLAALQKCSNPTTYLQTIYAYTFYIHHRNDRKERYMPPNYDEKLRIAEQLLETVPQKHEDWLRDLNDGEGIRDKVTNSLVPWTATDYILLLLRSCPGRGFLHFDELKFPPENLEKARQHVSKLSDYEMTGKCLIRYQLILCDLKLREAQFEPDVNKKLDLYDEAEGLALVCVRGSRKLKLEDYARRCLQYRLDYIDRHRAELDDIDSVYLSHKIVERGNGMVGDITICEIADKLLEDPKSELHSGHEKNYIVWRIGLLAISIIVAFLLLYLKLILAE